MKIDSRFNNYSINERCIQNVNNECDDYIYYKCSECGEYIYNYGIYVYKYINRYIEG